MCFVIIYVIITHDGRQKMQLSIVLQRCRCSQKRTTSIGAGGDQLIECVSAIKYGHAEFDAKHIYLEVTFFLPTEHLLVGPV